MAKAKRTGKKPGRPKQFKYKQGVSYDDDERAAIRVIRRVFDVGVAGAFRAGVLALAERIEDGVVSVPGVRPK